MVDRRTPSQEARQHKRTARSGESEHHDADGRSGDQDPPRILEEARRELDRAAADLERMTRLLAERTEALDSLEALVDQLLGLVDVAVLVLDADGRITAMSQGATDVVGELSGALGKPASTMLPSGALREPQSEDGAVSRVVTLPRGTTLVVLAS